MRKLIALVVLATAVTLACWNGWLTAAQARLDALTFWYACQRLDKPFGTDPCWTGVPTQTPTPTPEVSA